MEIYFCSKQVKYEKRKIIAAAGLGSYHGFNKVRTTLDFEILTNR